VQKAIPVAVIVRNLRDSRVQPLKSIVALCPGGNLFIASHFAMGRNLGFPSFHCGWIFRVFDILNSEKFTQGLPQLPEIMVGEMTKPATNKFRFNRCYGSFNGGRLQ